MENIMQPRDGVEKDPIGSEFLIGEAGQQPEIRGVVGHHDGRKSLSHLSEALLVPERTMAVQRWSHENLEIETWILRNGKNNG